MSFMNPPIEMDWNTIFFFLINFETLYSTQVNVRGFQL